LQLNRGSGIAAAAALPKSEPMKPLRAGRPARWFAEVEEWARERVSLTGAVAVASIAVLALEFAFPVKVEAAAMRATVETVVTLFALAAAWLVRAQLTQSRRLRDLLLVAALLTCGLVHLCWEAVPAALDLHSPSFFTAAGQIGALLVASVFLAAAWVGSGRVVADASNPLLRPAVIGLCVLGSSGLVALVAAPELGGGLRPAHGIIGAVDHPFATAVAVLAGIMLLAASAGYLRRAQTERDGATPLIGAGLIVLATARLSYIALNTVLADRLAPREALSLLAISLLLAAAIRQELRSRTNLARAAAIAERQRVARDLHDGLAQDLAFIAAHGEQIAAEIGDQHPVVIAARRALEVSRTAIAELSDPTEMRVQDALEALAYELRERFEISIAVDADSADDLSAQTRQDVSRITREAIANAARHGGAKNVTVSLTRTEDAHMLCIRDDGCGIDNVAARTSTHRGLGLRSMYERAEAAGGRMTIRKPGERGTVLEVVLP
jgi:signal transduction histidine kinase